MKSSLLYFAAALVFAGCLDVPVTPDTLSDTAADHLEPARQGSIGYFLPTGQKIIYEDFGEHIVLEGDMMFSPALVAGEPGLKKEGGFSISAYEGNRWPGSMVPYAIEPGMPPAKVSAIQQAIAEVHSQTSIRWSPRKGEPNFVLFKTGTGKCQSWIGMTGGAQDLETDCREDALKGQIMHEMGHAIGLLHEHSRIKADKFVTVTYNPPSLSDANFDINLYGTNFGAFDYKSIMIYEQGWYELKDINGVYLGTVDLQPASGRKGWNQTWTNFSSGDVMLMDFLYENRSVNSINLNINNDFYTDLVRIGEPNAHSVSIFLGRAAGDLTNINPTILDLNPILGRDVNAPRQFKVGDFNGDGRQDLCELVENSNYVRKWQGTTAGSFSVKAPFSPGNSYAIGSGDNFLEGRFNYDFRTDLVHFVPGSNYALVWLAKAGYDFEISAVFPDQPTNPGKAYLAGDFNGDGFTDILNLRVGHCRLWICNGAGGFDIIYNYSIMAPGDDRIRFRVGDFNGDKRDDVKDLATGFWYEGQTNIANGFIVHTN